MTLDAAGVRRRYLILQALRWLPTGLIIPVFVLLLQDRGLSLAQIGIAGAAQGLLVLLLELPTGGLADSLGRRPTLLAASVVDLVSLTVLALVTNLATAALAFALQGVYRALESGPLDAWFVDATLAADPEATYERGLAHGNATLSIAIAAGASVAGGLVALAPRLDLDPLALPVFAAVAMRAVNVAGLVGLMTEVRDHEPGAFRRSLRAVPATVRDGLAVVRGSRVLIALVAVEVFWGFGMATFEWLLPPRLAEVTGDAERAAAMMGPAVTAAWVVSALGAMAIPRITRRHGERTTAAAMRVLQGATIAGMGLFGGATGVLAAYLANYLVHGAANPVHQGLLHRQITSAHRTTVLSVNSMVSHPSGAIGGIVLGAVADGAGLTTAMLIGAVVTAIAAPLYLVRPRPGPATTAEMSGHAVP